MPKLIGLTGKYCAGKNHIASLLEVQGISVLDVDKLGYKVLESEKEVIFTEFGSDLQKEDGTLDRKLLGKRVFGNPQKLACLENIVHPAVNRLTEEWIRLQANGGGIGGEIGSKVHSENLPIVINAALLHHSSVFNRLDCIIIVKASFITRFFRALRRDKLSWLAVLKRFYSQKDFDSKYLNKNAEIYIVENPGLFLRGQGSKQNRKISAFLEGLR